MSKKKTHIATIVENIQTNENDTSLSINDTPKNSKLWSKQPESSNGNKSISI